MKVKVWGVMEGPICVEDVEDVAPDDIEGEGLENEYNDEYDSDINE